jgi:pilus assembly protein CpaB
MKAARIVVLGIAVAAGGLAAVLAGRSDQAPAPAPVVQIETIQVLVAQKDIGMGMALAAQDLQWQTWPASASNPAFIRQNERPNAIEQYAGSIVRVPMAAGEPVRDNKIIKAKGSGYMAAILPSGMRAISTEISPETRRDREAEKMTGVESHIAETILSDVRVLAIDQLVQEKDGQRVVVGKTATLELPQRKAELLAAARQMGTLSLTLRSIVDANAPNRDTPEDDETKTRNRINTVRFGVSTSIMTK